MDFTPGDRVRVIAETSAAYGRKGTVSKVFTMARHPDLKPSVHVDLDTVPEALKGVGIGPIGKTFVFPPKALEKVQGSRKGFVGHYDEC